VVVSVDLNGEKTLVAYYVSAEELDGRELRGFLGGRLPEHMLPLYYVHLDKLPLTGNGKLDRKLLPSPQISAGSNYQAPATEIEEKLVDIWAAILGVDIDKISVHANFFDLGGNSISIIRLNNLINRKFATKIPVVSMFASPTIVSITTLIVANDDHKVDKGNHINSEITEAAEFLKALDSL
jgi:acyl carrier protein